MGWTQPAVSQHLQALEREVGTPVAIRTSQGVQVTEAGEALLRHADAVASRLAAAEAEMAELVQLRSGTVRLAAFPSGAAVLVPAALARLQQQAPGIDVRLSVDEPPEALARLRAGDVDCALVFDYPDDGPCADSDLVLRRVAGDDMVLVLPPVLASGAGGGGSGGPVALANLADERWIAGCSRCRQHLLASARREGFVPDIRHETDDYVVVQGLVARRLGVSLLPRTAIEAHRNAEVEVAEVAGVGPRTVSLAHRSGVEAVPAVAAVIRALVEAGERA